MKKFFFFAFLLQRAQGCFKVNNITKVWTIYLGMSQRLEMHWQWQKLPLTISLISRLQLMLTCLMMTLNWTMMMLVLVLSVRLKLMHSWWWMILMSRTPWSQLCWYCCIIGIGDVIVNKHRMKKLKSPGDVDSCSDSSSLKHIYLP